MSNQNTDVVDVSTPGFKMFVTDVALTPAYEKEGDSGFDLRANIASTLTIEPGERKLVMTGVFVEMPKGRELQIRPRSGLANKHGITVLNSPGTIDSGYRQEIGVILLNTDKREAFHIVRGDRIAQGVVAAVERIVWHQLSDQMELIDTDRVGGFGSTGVK